LASPLQFRCFAAPARRARLGWIGALTPIPRRAAPAPARRRRRRRARALLAGDAHAPLAAFAVEHAALVLGAPGHFAHLFGCGGFQERDREVVGTAGKIQQRIAHELVESHHHRHRVARQAEEERVADAAEGHRPAGTHRDLPEQHLAQLGHQLLDEIGLADGNTAGGDNYIIF
jgi:hypothetical protein